MSPAAKKILFSLIFAILVFALPALAEGDNILINSDFEAEDSADFWLGGAADSSASYSGENGYVLQNPFGEVKDSRITHVLEYTGTVYIEKGKIYTLSGYALDPCAEQEGAPRAHMSLADGSKTITAKINGVGNSWKQFKTTFYASETGDYNFSLYFENGTEEMGFFIDDISLCESQLILSSMEIRGQTNVLIPASGSEKLHYTPVLYANDKTAVNFLSPSALYLTASDCPGVQFNSTDCTLTVTCDAAADSFIKINCSLENSTAVSPTSLTVSFTDNIIENSDFVDGDPTQYWTSSSTVNPYYDDERGAYIGIDTNDYGKNGYFTTIFYTTPQVLVEGAVYALHAKVKSNCPTEGTPIYTNSTEIGDDGTVYFNIADVCSNTWQDVTAAIMPERSGIYNIAITFFSRYDCTVFADDIELRSELLRPTYITLHAPGNIALPDVETRYPVSALVRDQLGNITEDASAVLSFSPGDEFSGDNPVIFDETAGTLTVFPDSSAGEYILSAECDGEKRLSSSIRITVSQDYIGDGGFEEKAVNEWWMAAAPEEYNFVINDDGSNKFAHVECEGSYFMLLNNSYMHLIYDVPYVFTAAVNSGSRITATAFLETLAGEAIPLVQFSFNGRTSITELFLPEESVPGRLLLYFQADDGGPFDVNIDNIFLKKAIVSASGAVMNGSFTVNGTASAEFSLYNNVAGSSDTSSCVINWYVSDSLGGEYTQLSESGKYIYFDTDFGGKYVCFEVTPVCPLTGFSGTPVRCLPQYIGFDDYEGGDFTDAPPSETDPSTPSQKEEIRPVQLNENASADFSDTENHWSRKYVAMLKEANIVSGRDNSHFDPDSAVSRCEFAKMLCLAFSVPESKNKDVFSDVPSGSWYRGYVSSLFASGITNGVSENLFAPEKEITRQEAVVLLMRLYKKCSVSEEAFSSHRFYDDTQISDWAQQSVYSAVALQITGGTPDGLFLPLKSATRAESAAMISRTLLSLRDSTAKEDFYEEKN